MAHGWVDPPAVDRHLHRRPVPRLGGVAIFLTVVGMVGAGLLTLRFIDPRAALSIRTTLAILGPATLIFLLGLYDDFRGLSAYLKFGAQALAGGLLYLEGIGIHSFTLFFGGAHVSDFLGLPLTIFWVLLITNAFNLIDGLDGLAAGAALFSTIVLLVVSLVSGDYLIAFLTVALAGALVGFLRFNFNPASIFLGDGGSLFIGFMLSAIGLVGSQKASTMVVVAIPVVCFGLPILDVSLAVVRRFLSGQPLFKGDREHIHHRLLRRGFSQRGAVLTLYGVSAVFGLLSLAMLHGGWTTALALGILGIVVVLGIPQLRYQEFKEMRRLLERTASQRRIIKHDLHIRHAVESLETCEDVSELCKILIAALKPSGFDGFRLRLPFTAKPRQALPGLVRQEPNGQLSCFWTASDFAEATWELRVPLVNGAGDHCGSLSVYKRMEGKPLLMDINLLSDGFPVAVAGAVRRSTIQVVTAAGAYVREQPSEGAEAVSM